MKNNILNLLNTGLFLIIGIGINNVCAINYGSTGSGNWNTSTSWSPSGTPGVGDNVTIASGHTITMDANPAGACAQLTINGQLSFGSNTYTLNVGAGGLVLGGGSPTAKVISSVGGTLNVSGDCTTSGASTVQVQRPSFIIGGTTTIIGGTTLEFTMATGTKSFTNLVISGTFKNNTSNVSVTINGNLQNDGTYNTGTGTLTFAGSSSNTITGTSSTTFAGGFTVNKGSSSAIILDAQSVIALGAGKKVTLTNGTLELSNAATSIAPFTADIASPPYLIPSTAGLWCNGATVNTNLSMHWTIAGLLRVSAGTVNVGSVSNNDLRAAGGSTSQIIVDGGNLNIDGKLSNVSGSDYIDLTISSGALTVPTQGTTTGTPFAIDNASDNFTMTGGNLIIERAGSANGGVTITAGTVSITGGTIEFGDAATPASQTMLLNSSSPIFNLSVNSFNAAAQLSANATVNGEVTILAGTLNAQAFDINLAGNWTNDATYSHNGGDMTFSGSTTIGGIAYTTFNSVTITGTLTGMLSDNFNVQGNWTNNGTFNHNDGTVTFNGTSAQTIGGTSTSDFYNITQSNAAGVSLTANQNLINILTISSGTFTATGYTFTLRSTAPNTARLATIPPGADFAGNIIIERYASGSTQWRNFGSPVSGATISSWSDDFATSGFTGATCGPADCALPGCAATCNWPSIYYYDEPTPGTYDLGYLAATNVTNSLVLGRGYFVYLGPNPVTFEVSGPPYKFARSLPVSFTGSSPSDDNGWNLVCNVYPCAKNWDAPVGWIKTNIDNAIYIYNSNGSYASYIAGIGTNGGSQYIASQQGFWVKANLASPALSVTEDVKASLENPSFLKQAPSPNTSHAEPAFKDFYVPPFTNNLPNSIMFTASGNGGKEDEMFIQFLSGASANFDSQYDAYDLENDTYLGVPNLSSLSADNKDLSINRMPDLTGNVSIPIRLRVSVADTYSLRRDSILMFPSSWCISLEDLATGNFVDLQQNISYSFYISDTTLAPRFILHLNNPIAVHQTFSASCFASNDGMAIAQGSLSGPWTYIWKDSLGNIIQTTVSNSADTLFASQGTYILEISSASCGTVNDTFVITAPPLLALSAAFTDVSCNGLSDGSATVSPSGGTPPYTYLWNTGDTTSSIAGLSIGNYSVTVTDTNGCSQTVSGFIDEPVHSIFSIVEDTLYVNFNDTAYFTNSSTGATFYEWYFGDGSPVDSSFAPSHFYQNAGTYTITLIASDNTPCYDTSYTTVVVLNTTDVASASASTSTITVLYDENGEVFLQFNLEQTARVNILIYNMLGEKITGQKSVKVKNEKIKLPFQSMPKGIYFAEVYAEPVSASGEEWRVTKKIIIK